MRRKIKKPVAAKKRFVDINLYLDIFILFLILLLLISAAIILIVFVINIL